MAIERKVFKNDLCCFRCHEVSSRIFLDFDGRDHSCPCKGRPNGAGDVCHTDLQVVDKTLNAMRPQQ